MDDIPKKPRMSDLKKPQEKTAREKRLDEERRKLEADDEIEAAIARSAVQQKKGGAKKKKKKWGFAALGGVLFLGLVSWLFMPYKGSKAYGVCKVFLEQNVRYPSMLRLNQVEEFSNWVRIWYTQMDAYGEYRLEPIQCYYRYDEQLGYHVMERVTISRREVDPENVEKFNPTIPAILENPPDLTLPMPLPDNLRNLRFDVNRFVRPIF